MEYTENQIIRMLQIYGQLNSWETYLLINSGLSKDEGVRAQVKHVRKMIREYNQTFPESIKNGLNLDIDGLEGLVTKALETYILFPAKIFSRKPSRSSLR